VGMADAKRLHEAAYHPLEASYTYSEPRGYVLTGAAGIGKG
jgi:hypothetical protein